MIVIHGSNKDNFVAGGGILKELFFLQTLEHMDRAGGVVSMDIHSLNFSTE